MYAIIRDGGRQYRVQEGQEVDVDYRDASKGDQIKFDQVLAVSASDGLQLGRPIVEGASVLAEVLGARMGKKIVVQKIRRRKNTRTKNGHRQLYTRIRIDKIEP